MIDIQLRLFGAFRKYELGESLLRFQIPAGSSVKDVKAVVAARLRERVPEFKEEQLLEDSALADESQVLGNHWVAARGCTLALLPPVCGG